MTKEEVRQKLNEDLVCEDQSAEGTKTNNLTND